jgi:hypothetical protein
LAWRLPAVMSPEFRRLLQEWKPRQGLEKVEAKSGVA